MWPAGSAQPLPDGPVPTARPGRRERGRLRRRLAELRELHDEQLLDLGGFIFDLYRFGRQRDEIVRGKLDALIATDHELREIERWLDEPGAVRQITRSAVGACPNCDALYTTDSSFCRRCGVALQGGQATAPGPRRVDPGHDPSPGTSPFEPPATEAGEVAAPARSPSRQGPSKPTLRRAARRPVVEPPPPDAPRAVHTPSEWLPPALNPDAPDVAPTDEAQPPAPSGGADAVPVDPAPASVWHPPPSSPPEASNASPEEGEGEPTAGEPTGARGPDQPSG